MRPSSRDPLATLTRQSGLAASVVAVMKVRHVGMFVLERRVRVLVRVRVAGRIFAKRRMLVVVIVYVAVIVFEGLMCVEMRVRFTE